MEDNNSIQNKAKIIIMDKIGGKGHRRTMLGSVTEGVLEATELPVVVVSPTSSPFGVDQGR